MWPTEYAYTVILGGMDRINLADRMTEAIARIFRTLGEPYRLRFLNALKSGEKTVGELVEVLEGNQPNVSKHLQILYRAGLASRRREGTSIYYRVESQMVFHLQDIIARNIANNSRAVCQELHSSATTCSRRTNR